MDRSYQVGSDQLAWIGGPQSPTLSVFALNSAYSFGAGAAVAASILTESTGTLTDIRLNVNSVTGTGSAGLLIELRQATTTAFLPSSTLLWSQTTGAVGSSGLVSMSVSVPPTLTAGQPYYLVIADAGGNATNFVTLQTGNAFGANAPVGNDITTTDGFSSNRSNIGSSAVAVQVGVVVYGGGILTPGQSTTASSNLAVGNAYTFDRDVEVCGVECSPDAIWGSVGFYIYSASQPPSTAAGSLPLAVATTGVTWPTNFVRLIFPPVRLRAGQKYYAVAYKGAISTTTPRIQTFSPGVLADSIYSRLLPLGGKCYRVIQDGSLDQWDEDTSSMMDLRIGVRPASNSGSGGISLARVMGGL